MSVLPAAEIAYIVAREQGKRAPTENEAYFRNGGGERCVCADTSSAREEGSV